MNLLPWLPILMVFSMTASLIAWFVLAVRHSQGPLLATSPRHPVPWGSFGAMLAMLLTAIPVLSFFSPSENKPTFDLSSMAFGIGIQVLLVGLFLFLVIIDSKAKWSDLGLPKRVRELGTDFRIGTIAWLAAIAPVYFLQAILVQMLGQEESSHPLIQMLLNDASFGFLAFAFVSAVIVAPVCEEIAFRLLLQGWLEKWEDQRLGWRHVEISSEISLEAEPPHRSLGGLPYGWPPILISATIFSLAHLGHGPDPVPLFLLGLILGYVYQRTHRLIPCIVTHLLFNLLSMVALFLTRFDVS